ncbi:serine/threonine phosphatase [Laspinema olomoucense]|uniref:serine/threonine phosphatase n=1 Tax=Laspinema olomoucense TaxID=3231600 RepID=UPI0021BA51A2|nr:serine/threonine phosphatase [Laspinema sp. D3d]MCT7971924.1 serine/threonine phosphatase [Laspinema sp. D3d]
MLVCSKCHSQNPNSHKFCQKCGMSLTHKSCGQCGAPVLASELKCHNCGAITGQIWLAIVDRQRVPQSRDVAAEVDTPAVEESVSVATMPTVEMAVGSVSEAIATHIPEESEIEPQAGTTEEASPTSSETSDVDTIASLSEVLTQVAESTETSETLGVEATVETPPEVATLKESPEIETAIEPTDADIPETPISEEQSEAVIPAATALEIPEETEEILPAGSFLGEENRYQLLEDLALNQLTQGEIQVKVLDCIPLQQSLLFALSSHPVEIPDRMDNPTPALALAIPAIAKAYLALHSQFYAIVPAIHDAWHWGDRRVLLLEDRSTQPALMEYVQTNPILPSQILHWLQEVTELWIGLEPWHCRQSLLEPQNLRLDVEDQILCLQRLYPDQPHATPTFTAVGQFWQTLLNVAQLTTDTEQEAISELQQVVGELASAELDNVEELRSRLETLQSQLHPATPISSPQSDPLYLGAITDNLDMDDSPTMVMPVLLESLEASGETDIGRQRTHNEDDFGIETQVKQRQGARAFSTHHKGLYILCDGMGGHEGGEIASALAVEKLREYFHRYWQDSLPTQEVISTGVLFANQAIYDLNQTEQRGGSGRMGTTLVMVLVQDQNVAVAHVGDSRLYRFTPSQGLHQVTVDHEVGQREIQRGVDPETAYLRPDAYQLTQALGPRNEDFVSPDVQFFKIEEDTLLILASDGLTDNDLLETHYLTHVEPLLNPEMPLEPGVKALIDLGNQYNGHDNITAIAVRALVRER